MCNLNPSVFVWQVERDQLSAAHTRIKKEIKYEKELRRVAEQAKQQAEKSQYTEKDQREHRRLEKSLFLARKELDRLVTLSKLVVTVKEDTVELREQVRVAEQKNQTNQAQLDESEQKVAALGERVVDLSKVKDEVEKLRAQASNTITLITPITHITRQAQSYEKALAEAQRELAMWQRRCEGRKDREKDVFELRKQVPNLPNSCLTNYRLKYGSSFGRLLLRTLTTSKCASYKPKSNRSSETSVKRLSKSLVLRRWCNRVLRRPMY
jgi:hypothetical protein